jgi:4-amino-4-deoxy-L-arabinose transferase-like glycosyltransferase
MSRMGRPPFGIKKGDLLLAGSLALAAGALYGTTLAPTVLPGDAGEFQFVPYLFGVAHPTGYPLYCLLGGIWSRLLPAGDVAFRLNLFSAFWAALTVGLLYPTARSFLRGAVPSLSLLGQRLVAAVAALLFAVTPTFWSQAIIAEVYSLHVFIVVALFCLLLHWREDARPLWLGLAALCFGLGLAHHSTTLLLAPAALAYVWLCDRAGTQVPGVFRQRRLVLGCLALAILPLALYLYLPLRAPHTPYLHLPLTADRELTLYENTPAGLVDFILGGPFRGSVDLTVSPGQRLAMAWGFLRGELRWVGILLALLGLVQLVRARQWPLLALTVTGYLASVAFNLVYTIGDIHVLFIPSYVFIVLWSAAGVGFLFRLGAQLAQTRPRQALLGAVLSGLVVVGFVALPLYMAVSGYADQDHSHKTGVRAGWEAILDEPLPIEGILVSNDRNDIMPMWYLQFVEHRRADLLGLFPLITPEFPSLGQVLDLALSTGRPTFLIKEMPGIEIKVDVVPDGRLWRVVGPAASVQPPSRVQKAIGQAVTLIGYDHFLRLSENGGTLTVHLYWEALHTLDTGYHTFVHLVDAAGHRVAQSDHQPGGVYHPTSLWRPGERLRDDHYLALPAGTPEGTYTLLVGMYALAGEGSLEQLGDPLTIGPVEIRSGVGLEPPASAEDR